MSTQPPLPTRAETEAAAWVARAAVGPLDKPSRREREAWLAAAPAHAEALARAEALWHDLAGLGEMAGARLAEARAARPRRGGRLLRLARAPAAALALAAAVAWYLDPLAALDQRTERTAVGELRRLDLPDGSRLELDTATVVTVHFSRRTREIRLERGQVAATVVHGDPRPFDVLAGPVRVRDVGTDFAVRSEGGGVAVTVLDGEVEARAAPGALAQRLVRGQRLRFTDGAEPGRPESVDPEAASAWREGRLAVSGLPLGEVLAELGRYHQVPIAVNGRALLSLRVTGVLPTRDLPLALRTIAVALPVQARQVGTGAWRLDPRRP